LPLDPDPHAPLALAERILELLDQGRFTATYKYAVLLALLDLCLENAARDGAAPDLLTTRQLAVKIVELYWPHTRPWATRALRQSSGPGGGQAEIVAGIEKFRAAAASDGSTPLAEAVARAPARYRRLLDFVEWKLIEMPLPRLQTIGDESVTFLYAINWTQSVRQPDVGRYQRGEGGPFDNRIHLRAGVGEALVRLNHLLRPLIHHQWAVKVATLNRLDEYQLERFLFGAERVPLERVRGPIIELQEGRCFYCAERLASRAGQTPDVDHFIPWSRYPDDGLENLVVAHARCNAQKSDFLAAAAHVDHWRARTRSGSPVAAALDRLAEAIGWTRHPDRTPGVARALYLRLPEDARLWLRGEEFVTADRPALEAALDATAA